MAITDQETFDELAAGTVITTSNTTFTTVTGTSLEVTDTALHGPSAMDIVNGFETDQVEWSTTADPLYMRAYVRRNTDHSLITRLFLVANSNDSETVGVDWRSDGAIRIVNGASEVDTSTFTQSTGTWARIEWEVDATNDTQELRIFHGANIEGTTPDETLSGTGTLNDVAAFRCGRILDRYAPFLVDQIAIGTTDWLGPASAVTPVESGYGLVAYWPMEDGQEAESATSPLAGVQPMTIQNYNFAADDSLPGSKALPVLEQGAKSILSGSVPEYDYANNDDFASSAWHVECMLLIATNTNWAAGTAQLFELSTTGIFNHWDIRLTNAGIVQIRGTEADNEDPLQSVSEDLDPGDMFDQWIRVALAAEYEQLGDFASFNWWFRRTIVGGDSYVFAGDNVALRAPGKVKQVSRSTSSAVTARTTGHMAVFRNANVAAFDGADNAFLGERAATRAKRLCGEEGIAFTLTGDEDTSMPMGYQRPDTFVNLIQECEDADRGVLYENSAGLAYVTRQARYNQSVQLALDNDLGHLAEPPKPTRDDQRTVNEATVTREEGSTHRARDADSIAKLGLYDVNENVNVRRDRYAEQIAHALVYRGTRGNLRWPSISIDLHANTSLITDWLSLDLNGNRATIAHTIDQLPGIDVDLLVEGWTERFDQVTWRAELNCIPAESYTVGELDTSRLESNGVTVESSFVAGTSTSMSVTVVGPLLTTNSSQFPLEIDVSGVVLEVTAISGGSSPMTMTVTQTPVNGVEKTIQPGEVVLLHDPMRLTL